MNLVLVRSEYLIDGVFSELRNEAQELVCYCLERGYPKNGGWEPKLPPGKYRCQRGQHRLHSGLIETFEILDVPGHTGILFHPGNTEKDSDGCVLLGISREGCALAYSRRAFYKFLELQRGCDNFELTVKEDVQPNHGKGNEL